MSIKSIVFDGERYTVASLRAQAARMMADDRIGGGGLADYVADALLELAARRKFGRRAWVYGSRIDSWRQDGSARHVAVTVGIGAPTRHGQRCVRMFVMLTRDEIVTATAAMGGAR